MSNVSVRIDTSKWQRRKAKAEMLFSGPQMAIAFYGVVHGVGGASMKTSIREKDLIWRKKMISSISTSVQSVGLTSVVFALGPKVGYSETLEKGLPHTPNIDLLRQWVRDKLGLRGTDADQVTFLLFRKFKTQGAIPHPFKRRAVEIAGQAIVPALRTTVRLQARRV